MTQVSVNVNGRSYRLRCAPGQEDRLVDLASHVKTKLDALFAEHGNVGDERILLMCAIMLADELFDTRAALEQEKEARAFAEELAAEYAEEARKAVQKQTAGLTAAVAQPTIRKGAA